MAGKSAKQKMIDEFKEDLKGSALRMGDSQSRFREAQSVRDSGQQQMDTFLAQFNAEQAVAVYVEKKLSELGVDLAELREEMFPSREPTPHTHEKDDDNE